MFDSFIQFFADIWDGFIAFVLSIFDYIYGFITWSVNAMWSVVLGLLPETIRSYLSADALGPFGDMLAFAAYVLPVWSMLAILGLTLATVGSVRLIRWILKVAPIPGVNG